MRVTKYMPIRSTMGNESVIADDTDNLHWGDGLAIAVYFILVLAVGLWASIRAKKESASGYFLAGKEMTWMPIGASIYASNVGAPMFIGLAGGAASSGIGITIFEWQAVYMLVLLGWIFVPVYISSGCYTMPEYLKKRFGGTRLRVYLSLLGLLLYILTKISIEMYAGALFIQRILDWNLYLSVVLILAVTALYTVAGGLTAVIYTDTLQTVVLLIGSFVLVVIGLVEVGSYEQLKKKYMSSYSNETWNDYRLYGNHTCGLPREDSFHIWRGVNSDLPWPGTVFGLLPIAIWVWCTDQVMVQRTLSAKNLSHAKGGSLLAAYLKLLPFLLFILPGMMSRVLYPEEVACASPESCEKACKNPAGCTNVAYPWLVLRILPPGLRGLMLAALLAALMSSLTSIFNSASSMFTLDIWQTIRRQAKERELMLVGRTCVLALVGVSILWIPILQSAGGGTLWNYMQAVSSYIAPPWCVCFVLGVFWTRTTEQGAFWGLITGFVVGIIRMGIDFAYQAPLCGSGEPDTRPAVLTKVHFLHFSIILSAISSAVTVAVSLLTKPQPPEKLRRVTWWTRNEELPAEEFDDEENEKKDEIIITHELEMEENTNEESVSKVKRCLLYFYHWICGAPATTKAISKADRAEHIKMLTSIEENPFWAKILNINCMIVLLVCTFLLGYFG